MEVLISFIVAKPDGSVTLQRGGALISEPDQNFNLEAIQLDQEYFCQFAVYGEPAAVALDLKKIAPQNPFWFNLGPNRKAPLLSSTEKYEVSDNFDDFASKTTKDPETGAQFFEINRKVNGKYDNVLRYDCTNTIPFIIVFLHPRGLRSKPIDRQKRSETIKLTLTIKMSNGMETKALFAKWWKGYLRSFPSYEFALYYRLPNSTGQCAIVDPTSLSDDGDVFDFKISVERCWVNEIPCTKDSCEEVFGSISDFEIVEAHDKMEFVFPLESKANLTVHEIVIEESFRSALTPKGQAALASLHRFVRESAGRWMDTKNLIYAPITSIAQSSGLGKSKLAYELLSTIPGIYFVIREDNDSGYPFMNPWSTILQNSIFVASVDDTNDAKVILKTRVGQFLLYLVHLIECYVENVITTIQSGQNSETVIRKFASLQIEGKLDFLEIPYKHKFEDPTGRTCEEILVKIARRIEDSIVKLHQVCNLQENPPFLLVFDEVSLLDPKRPDRLHGFHIIRRVLHSLPPSCNILALALGTNSSLIEFLKEASSDSLRTKTRINFLDPYVPGFNYDVLWGYVYDRQAPSAKYDLSRVRVCEELLLNPRYEQLLVSLGRPLWSSLDISQVKLIAVEKLKNGSMKTGEPVLAMWAIRAGIFINPCHKVAKTMVKSIMATCFHSSTDGSELLIGYPSDPVLACAAREIMSNEMEAAAIFQGLQKFYNSGAVDMGQLGESIAAMLVLRALDQASNECVALKEEYANKAIDGLGELNLPRNAIFENANPAERKEPPPQFTQLGLSKVWTVRSFLVALLGQTTLDNLIENELIIEELLNGLVNLSHFVPTQKDYYWDKQAANELPTYAENGQACFVDPELLNWAMLRQAGLFMPSRYFGIDLIIPVCLSKGILTYMSLQIKTGETCLQLYKILGYMPPMIPGQHMVACVHHSTSQKNCKSCEEGDAKLPKICQSHLSLIICIGNDVKSVRAFEKNMVHLETNVFGTRIESNLKNLPRKKSRKSSVTYICSLGEDALLPGKDPNVKSAIRGLLSLTRNIFASRICEGGFQRLVDHMQQVPVMYPNAYTDLCRARKLPIAKITYDSDKFLQLATPPTSSQAASDNASEIGDHVINLAGEINFQLESSSSSSMEMEMEKDLEEIKDETEPSDVASVEMPPGQGLNNLFLDDSSFLEFVVGLSKCKKKNVVTAGPMESNAAKRKRLSVEGEVEDER